MGQDHRVVIPVSCMSGSLLLLFADTLSRSMGNGSELVLADALHQTEGIGLPHGLGEPVVGGHILKSTVFVGVDRLEMIIAGGSGSCRHAAQQQNNGEQQTKHPFHGESLPAQTALARRANSSATTRPRVPTASKVFTVRLPKST